MTLNLTNTQLKVKLHSIKSYEKIIALFKDDKYYEYISPSKK